MSETEQQYQARVGVKISTARTAAGVSRKRLTAGIGASSPSQITRWETGRQQPRLYWIARIARFLGVPVSELVPPIEETSDTETEDPTDGIYNETGTPAGA